MFSFYLLKQIIFESKSFRFCFNGRSQNNKVSIKPPLKKSRDCSKKRRTEQSLLIYFED